MKIQKRLFIIGLLLLILTMVVATQYAVTKVAYEYAIVHPSDAAIRFIGSDNSSDGIRVLRTNNLTNNTITLFFGNLTTNMKKTYTAAFGIVNEEPFPVEITHINVTSSNTTYMKIWIHSNRTANAESNLTDPSAILMYDNGTYINMSNIATWILAAGNVNSSNMCSNISDRINNSIPTPWDTIAQVRYSENNTNAISGISDFVWVQITIDIPADIDKKDTYAGIIWITFKATTH